MDVTMKCSANDIRESLNSSISKEKPQIDGIVQQILDEMHEIFFADAGKTMTSHHFDRNEWYNLVNYKVFGGRESDQISKSELPGLIDDVQLVERKVVDMLTKNGFRVVKDSSYNESTYDTDPEYYVIWGLSENDCKEEVV